MTDPLRAMILNCTLKASPAESSTDVLANQLIAELEVLGVNCEIVRMADYDVKPGVEFDMGDGDDWPKLCEKMLTADIFIIATPTWMGHMTSFAQRALERLDAELGETDDIGHYPTLGKVAGVVVVGNEDGAHAICADLFQGLNDVGFTIAANAVTYWNDHAMGSTDYKDLEETPQAVASATHMFAINTAHVARLLKAKSYPNLNE